MKKIIFLCLLLMSFPAFAADQKSAYERVIASGTIRCAYFSWPPYFSTDANTGQHSGMNYDYMMMLGDVLGLKIEWTEEANPGVILEGLETGRYDVACVTLWPDPARLKNAYLSLPTFYNTVYPVVRADDTRFDGNPEMLLSKDITAIGVDGDVTYSMAQKHTPNAKLLALPQNADGMQMFQSIAGKKADVAFLDRSALDGFNDANGNILKVASGLPPTQYFPECLAVAKNEMQLGLLLDRGIRTLTDSGDTEKLLKKYAAPGVTAPVRGWEP